MNMTAVTVMVAVTQAFASAVMGAGSIVQERHEGLATLPGNRYTGMVGRILAASLTSFVSMLAAVAIGLVYGADFHTAAGLVGTLVVLAVTAVAAGAVGVMLGYVVDTPQGAVTFIPLVMAAMFLNTAMMPREMYQEVLRPLVDVSPLTAVTALTAAPLPHQVSLGDVGLFLLWFGGLIALSLVVLARKVGSGGRGDN